MRKKLFAVIMSVMMMVTFMPAMAFAADSWNEDFSAYGTNTKVVKVLQGSPWNGKVKSYALDGIGGIVAGSESEEYFDLSLASVYQIKKADEKDTLAAAGDIDVYENSYKFDSDQKKALLGETAGYKTTATVGTETVDGYYVDLRFLAPKNSNYYTAYTDDTTNTPLAANTVAELTQVNGQYAFMELVEYDTEDIFNVQKDLKQAVKFVGTAGGVKVINASSLNKTLEIGAKDKAAYTDAAFYKDEVKVANKVKTAGSETTEFTYDGAEHTVIMKELAGVSATYQLKNAAGKYEDVEAIKFKNAGSYEFKLKIKDSDAHASTPAEVTGTIKVKPATAKYEFALNDRLSTPGRFFTVHKGFKATDYVVANGTSDEEKAAVKADKELLDQYFLDFYEIKEEPGVYDTNNITATIKTKSNADLTTADKDALVTKYADLFTNYAGKTAKRSNILTNLVVELNTTSYANVCHFTVDQETLINWTKAPLTKTFKAKNGKLAKNRYFKIKAKSVSSEKINYYLTKGGSMIKINKTSGKITVKKGLKKGTYKVYVHAYVGYDKNHNKGNDSYPLKVKIK